MIPSDIAAVLAAHAKWLRHEEGGSRAILTGANLADADLTGAILADANLARANLADASLTGANLADAKISESVTVFSWTGSGRLLSFGWVALATSAGVILRYGCEQHALIEWPALIDSLCAKHVPGREAEYAKALRALVAFVGALVAS